MRKLFALLPLALPLTVTGCDLIEQATSTIVVGGLVVASPEITYASFYNVPSEVAAQVWLGERASATSTEAPQPLSGASVSVAVGGTAIDLPETSEKGVYATNSVDQANLTYQPGGTYTFDATVSEVYGGETVAPNRLAASNLTFTPALGGGSPLPNVSTHAQNAALTVAWPTEFGKYGLVTVFRADKNDPTKPQLVYDNRPKTGKEIADLVLGTPPTSFEIPAATFAQAGLYALVLVATERGDIRDNTSIASPLLVGSGAAVLFTVGTP